MSIDQPTPTPEPSAPSPEEAHEIMRRFNASHFNLTTQERARYSIPADPRRDDDLRMAAFINSVAALRAVTTAQLAELAEISLALGSSEGHSSVAHIKALRSDLARVEGELEKCNYILLGLGQEKVEFRAQLTALQAENGRLREAMSRVYPECHMLHHKKGEYHDHAEDCPVKKLWDAALSGKEAGK